MDAWIRPISVSLGEELELNCCNGCAEVADYNDDWLGRFGATVALHPGPSRPVEGNRRMLQTRRANGSCRGQHIAVAAALCVVSWAGGCQCSKYVHEATIPGNPPCCDRLPPAPDIMPRELAKVAMPDYVIEPPDVLLIEAVKVVPLPPYRIGTLDVLALQVAGTLPDRPLVGQYEVEPGGGINLGPPYGIVKVLGMTIPEATQALEKQLRNVVQEPIVSLSLVETSGNQQIAGEHIVGPDGMVTLGVYGKVFIAGMTQDQAKRAIESHLARYLEAPEVSVDIYGYNSKVYYIITQGAGLGDGVARFPITGNETVLDAIAQINGLESVSSKKIWIARPAPKGSGCDHILPVDWYGITQRADTATNYQLYPGDRLFVAEDKIVAFSTFLDKVTAPVERLFGFTLLGNSTVRTLQRGRGGSGFGSGTGGF
jgi:polysaccharide biosynthesis/export protein